jgi:hypothetical protein
MAFDFTEDILNMKEAFMGPPEKKEKRKGLDGVNDLLSYFNEVSDDNSIQTRKQAALNPIGPTSKDKYKSFADMAGFNIPRDFSKKNEVPSEENSFGMAYGKDGSLSNFTDKNTDKRINKRRDAYGAASLISMLTGERDRQQSVTDAAISKKDPVKNLVTTGYRGLPLLSRNDQRAIEDDGITDLTAKNKEYMKIKLPDVTASSRPKLGTTARGGVGASARLGSGKNDQLKKARKLRRMGFGPAALKVSYDWASTPESDAPNIFNQAMRDQLTADRQQADAISQENQRLAALLRKNAMKEAKKSNSLFELKA